MNFRPARLFGLFLLAIFLNSPFIIVPYFFAAPSPIISPVSGTVINFGINKYPLPRPQESQFAILIAANPNPQVLGTEVNQEVAETTHSPSPSRSYFERQRKTRFLSNAKGPYTIAVLGDSMIDVMQPDLPQLRSALGKFYPHHQFKLLNFGVGASNIESGLARLTSEYSYLGQGFPSLLSQNPDIIVVESFAYNHWDNNQTGLDRQWLALAELVETIKGQGQAKIVLAATIGPDETTLCDGIDGLNLLPDQKREKAQAIRAYLQNLINFATSQGYPLADAYHPSLDGQGNGRSVYINQGDHLHPSGPGGELLAQKIAEAVAKNNLL